MLVCKRGDGALLSLLLERIPRGPGGIIDDLDEDDDNYDGNIDNPSNGWHTALMVASKRGHYRVIGLLLEHGANANKTDVLGWTPVMMATMYGRVSCAALLLNHGANMNV